MSGYTCQYLDEGFCNYSLDCYKKEYVPPSDRPLCRESDLDRLIDSTLRRQLLGNKIDQEEKDERNRD